MFNSCKFAVILEHYFGVETSKVLQNRPQNEVFFLSKLTFVHVVLLLNNVLHGEIVISNAVKFLIFLGSVGL